jgi:cytochrome P450
MTILTDTGAVESGFRPPAPLPRRSGLGFFGLLAALKRNPLECWTEQHFTEPVCQVRLPFAPVFLVHDPAAIKHVLLDNSENYRKDALQRRVLSAGLNDGLLSVEGERWSFQRRTLAPVFARKNIAKFAPAIIDAVDALSGRWRGFDPNMPVNVASEMTLLTLNVLALTIFSEGLGGDAEEFKSAMNVYFGTIGRIGAFDLLGLPDYVPRPGGKAIRQILAYFRDVTDTIIAARRQRELADGSVPTDLLSLLLHAVDPVTGTPMTVAEVHSNILTFLSAGHETTANALTWSMFLLSQSPQWLAQVEQEAERELAGPPESLTDRLTITRAVIDEAVRLFPPIAALSRVALGPDEIAGQAVKPGSLIVIAPYVLHRHRMLWNDPDVFDPSRFLGDSRQRINRFAYMPFGAGARICIGSAFALQEATIALATLVNRFRFSLEPGSQVWPSLRVTLRPQNGVPMRIEPKNDRTAVH